MVENVKVNKITAGSETDSIAQSGAFNYLHYCSTFARIRATRLFLLFAFMRAIYGICECIL